MSFLNSLAIRTSVDLKARNICMSRFLLEYLYSREFSKLLNFKLFTSNQLAQFLTTLQEQIDLSAQRGLVSVQWLITCALPCI